MNTHKHTPTHEHTHAHALPQVKVELDKALPALQAAEEALNVLTKKDMSELKAYAKPPALVELTLGAVMTCFRCGWEGGGGGEGDVREARS